MARSVRATASQSLSLEARLGIREAFFQNAGIDPRQFLVAFDHVPGLHYFVKDAQSRTIINTREYAELSGHRPEEESVGKRPSEYLGRDLAEHYEHDDRKVLESGQPLLNIIEIGFNERGIPDWIVTNKFPLRNAAGHVVGIMGTMQSFEGRLKNLQHLGKLSPAADFIRQNVGEKIFVRNIADHVGMSERSLQRLFRRLIGLSIQKFMIHSRVHAAAQMLTRSDEPMSKIALACGFADQSALTNTFRRLIGMTPKDYRKRFLVESGSVDSG